MLKLLKTSLNHCIGILCCSLSSLSPFCSQAQTADTLSRLRLNKPIIAKSDFVEFTYTPRPIDKAAEIRCVLYYYAGKLVYASDLITSLDVDGSLKGRFKVPDSALAIGLAFKTGSGRTTKVDDNLGKGYVFPVCDSNNPVPGGFAAEAMFYSDPSGSFYTGVKQNLRKSSALMQTEFKRDLGLMPYWVAVYLPAFADVDKSAAIQLLSHVWKDEINNRASEDQLLELIIAAETLVSFEQVSLMRTEVEKLYPAGGLVLGKLAERVQDEQNILSKAKLLNDLVETMGRVKLTEVPKSIDFTFNIMAIEAIRRQDLRGFRKYSVLIHDRTLHAETDNVAASSILKQGIKGISTDSLAAEAVQLVLRQKEVSNLTSSYLSPTERKDELLPELSQYLDTYAAALAVSGDLAAALKCQERSVSISSAYPERNGRYISYLLKLKKYDEAKRRAEDFVGKGTADITVRHSLETLYKLGKGNLNGFDAYFSGLVHVANNAEKEKITSQLLDIPSTGFELSDLKGQRLALSSLKGKVVVVDFWATWCGPCKASFPAMQHVMQKYRSDKNVVFLFVNTWESYSAALRKKKVRDLMQQLGYDFPVLLDEKGKRGRYYTVADAYQLRAVPTKLIIGRNGHIRFRTEGFSSTTNALENELSAMIELAKK